MDHKFLSSSQHLIKDLVIMGALAFLIPLTTNRMAELIAPLPRFEDFPCQVDGMHCRDADTKIRDLHREIDYLTNSLKTAMPEQRTQINNKMETLEREVKRLQQAVADTRQARDRALQDSRSRPQRIQTYITLALGILAIIIGYVLHMFPLQPGFIAGGIITLFSGYITAWDTLSNILKLITLLIALALIIAISFRTYRKETT